MGDVVGWIFVALTILVFGYVSVRQIRDTLEMKRRAKLETGVNKRKLAGNYLMAISLSGFLLAYMMNVAAGILSFVDPFTEQHALINSDSTAFACFVFLAIYVVSRFAIVPKEEKPMPLLKTK